VSRPEPTFGQRLIDFFFVRYAAQTIIAALVLAAIVGVGLWWWRNGGADGRLVDHDQVPGRPASFVVAVNSAPAAELAELPLVGDALAERIIDYRRKHGPFRKLDDLRNVKGIGDKTLEALAPHVTFDDR
jgi:competence protein ComEA